jgi:hypothetical protein
MNRPASKYASRTDVSIERSEAEVKTTLRRYGCYDITAGEYHGQSFLIAHYAQRRLKIVVNMPPRSAFEKNAAGNTMHPKQAMQAWEKECRRQWRVLVLLLKAKFEAVMASPEIFEYEFLAYIMDPATGRTIGETIVPQIAGAYEGGEKPLQLQIGGPKPR